MDKKILWMWAATLVVVAVVGFAHASTERYVLHTHSILIQKIDTWTGRTWIMTEGKWVRR
jgi:hypothetical protein